MSALPKAATLTPEEIARRSKSNFLTSFVFLDRSRRRGLSAIYAFCRAVDDAVDDAEDPDEALEMLTFWRGELDRVEEGIPETSTGRAIAAAVQSYGLDVGHLREVVDGVAMDIEPKGFGSLEDLDAYCHKVASAVGLACLPVFGAHGPGAEAYARELGLALQLTNVLRDLRSDAEEGRIYVPRDHLARHGVDPQWLPGSGPATAYADGGPVDRMVKELVGIARQRFERATELLPEAQRRALLPAEVMAVVYAALLESIAERGGRIDRPGRPRISRRRKAWLALRTWWRGRR
jgi:phytoene synthase